MPFFPTHASNSVLPVYPSLVATFNAALVDRRRVHYARDSCFHPVVPLENKKSSLETSSQSMPLRSKYSFYPSQHYPGLRTESGDTTSMMHCDAV